MDISNHKLYLTVKDHSVSKEAFNLYRDESIDLVFTYPQPDLDKLPSYYESEDYISHTDGSRSLFEKAYQFVKQIALKNKLKYINQQKLTKGILLDIGAGTGDFLAVAQQDGWQTKGIEPNEKARTIAQTKGVSIIESTSAIAESSIDIITMWHVLEHVPDVEKQIKELKRILKPTGTIFIAVPNFNSFDANYYGSFWAAYDVPRHLWHFSQKSIKHLFARENFHLLKTLPMPFDAFYVSLLSEKYKTGSMNFIKAFLIGLKSNWKGRATGEYSSHIYILKNDQKI
ncbi:class I SAM-dependent methyltransferase [Flavobacterium sp.]|uniref:class I SAM-dependent methyltransferase n=1 Tax=Flavobacterium sp. TaxID=239 RepID=UPI00262D5AA8|nr:class I SAM-dependent methyltransferase [Flavobacterium sp.]